MYGFIVTALMLIAAPAAAQDITSSAASTTGAATTAASTSATTAGTAQAPASPILASGIASFYGDAHAGNRTASGERFDPDGMTAAHRTLPFGTRIKITDPASGRSVTVRVNDRGPFHKGRVLDMSEGAARELGIHRKGRAHVQIALAN